MASVSKRRARRKHSPDILRMKRVAHNLGIPWRDVTAERDALRRAEDDRLADGEQLRQAAWIGLAGLAAGPWWRGGFQRRYKRLLAEGGDHVRIVGSGGLCWDRICQELRGVAPICAEWSDEDIWEYCCSDYERRQTALKLYSRAIKRLVHDRLDADDARDREFDADEQPF